MLRLRLGSHWPSVVTGRWTDGGIARAHMYCKSNVYACKVEDERVLGWKAQPIRRFELSSGGV